VPPIPLHVHSYYSLLEGVASPEALAQAAARAGLPALALTDHHSLTGAVEFVEACRLAHIRPLLGLVVDVQPPPSPKGRGAGGEGSPLVLLAADAGGWANLCRLSTLVHQTDSLTVAFDALAQHGAGLICLTGGTRGRLTQLAREDESAATQWLGALHEIFADRLYVELQRHTPEDDAALPTLTRLAEAHAAPTAATQSIFYLTPDQSRLQRTLAAIRTITPVNELSDDELAPSNAHWLAPVALESRFAEHPRALAATEEIAARCTFELPLGQPHYPEIKLQPGQTAPNVLREKAYAGARDLYGELTPAITARLDHELSVIAERGYAPLFLIMEDVLGYARRAGVPISSRGSAASSLVAHCLGLTAPDPIRLDLYFERFLNPARSTPPDIDTDLCSRRREQVLRYVFDAYGADRVAMVATIVRFRERSALREVAKAYGLPPKNVSELVEALPDYWYRNPGEYKRGRGDDPFAVLRERYPSPVHRAIFDDAAQLIKWPRHLSVHPGGVVITPGPITDRVATQPASNGVTITQFDMEAVEHLGLIKMDLLGIRGLTVIGDVAEALRAREPAVGAGVQSVRTRSRALPVPARLVPALGRPQGLPLRVLDDIAGDDAATRDLVRAARTIGCFQIESPGMRATLREINAGSIDDLMTALALYRPGPIVGGMKDSFVRRHLGKEKVEHIHPALSSLLADTFGVILYQEQVLRIAHNLAGMSMADADLLRRAMSHFDPGERMKTLRLSFIEGAQQNSGVPAEVGARVWELMAAFAGYGFPKAHAASYAIVAWRAAWCKAHVPAEFMAAVLANWGGYYSQRVYLTEARRMGLRIHPPHVNHSRQEFSVMYDHGQPHLYMGLNQVRELTQRTQQTILRERPFGSLPDFLVRVDPRAAEVKNLVKVGAFEGLGNIPALLRQLQTQDWQPGQFTLFGAEAAGGEDWSLPEKVSAQNELLGASVSAHPLELVADQLAGTLTTVEAVARLGQRIKVAGMRQTWRKSRTARGEDIYFMTLEDLDGMLDVVIFGDVYRRHRSVFSAGPGPYILEGLLETDPEREEPVLRAERVWPVA
jgi:DNA-directed DNA polymerase III PolC